MKASSFTLLFLLLASTLSAQVSSGMWLPHQAVTDEVYQLLRKDGIKLSCEQIYTPDGTCLSTAILSLSQDGGLASPFATASFISDEGLIITNYHCVSRYIKDISTEESTGVGQKTVNRKRPFATCRSISCFLATTSLTNSPKASRACLPR